MKLINEAPKNIHWNIMLSL